MDYKTGRHLLTVDDARSSLPLALYALAAERVMRRPCHRVELHHLPTGRVLAWEHSPQSLARQLARAEDIAGECALADERYREPGGDRGDATFPPRPGLHCGWCDYRGHCPEGSAAASGRRRRGTPWTSMPRPPWSRTSAPPRRAAARPVLVRRMRNGAAPLGRVPEGSQGRAVVSGASTAGEWAAPGMQERSACSLRAIRCWVAGGQASSSSP